jgi:hypothetical protein
MEEVRITDIEVSWRHLLDEERSAFARCVELDKSNPKRTVEKSEAVRNWHAVACEVVRTFSKVRVQQNYELQPFPWEVMTRLGLILEELSNGTVPTFVADASRQGRPALRPRERRHIAYAVCYLEAAKLGEITDRSPNKTVRRAYNVTPRTVQGWMQRRDEICRGFDFHKLPPRQLEKKMKASGEVYSRIGRSAPSDN